MVAGARAGDLSDRAVPAERGTSREALSPADRTATSARAAAVQIEELRAEMRRRHVASADVLGRVHPGRRQSAANLIDYLTLRHHDIRQLQDSLSELGLSSLGRSEEHVITSLERVLWVLHLLAGQTPNGRTEAAVGFGEGRRTLERNAEDLLGPCRAGRPARMLVTMPTEAAEDRALVRDLVDRGMDCARINCAHDDEEQWLGMVQNVRRAARQTGRPCPIFMDIPGPKLRTGAIEPGPRVLRLRPERDLLGRPTSPARAILTGSSPASPPADGEQAIPRIPVPSTWISDLSVGDRIHLRDTRGSSRTLLTSGWLGEDVWVEAADTTYIGTGTLLKAGGRVAATGLLPPMEQFLVLRVGDILTLTDDTAAVKPTSCPLDVAGVTGSATGAPVEDRRHPHRIGCALPEALDALQPGHRVFFDDGRIGGVAVAVRSGEVDVKITQAAAGGSKLRAGKGINLPDSHLRLPALRPEGEPVLPFIVEHADLVGLSFAQEASDVQELQRQLHELGGSRLGVVLKIETARGFSNLPEMLLAAMASERVGVMIARGDLAVECGFERLAEVQEEMLCLCDAAHIPVIWATEVLDRMARTGQPSRAEISDAAMACRAECVMLNKGPYIGAAVSTLDDILQRMSGHQRKKVTLLRRLRSWYPDGD